MILHSCYCHNRNACRQSKGLLKSFAELRPVKHQLQLSDHVRKQISLWHWSSFMLKKTNCEFFQQQQQQKKNYNFVTRSNTIFFH